METLDPFVTPLVAAVAVFLVHFLSQGRFRELEAKIDAVSGGLGARIDAVSGGLGARIDAVSGELEAKIDAVSGELEAKIDAVSGELGAKVDAVIRELEQVRVENRDLRAGLDSVRSDLTQLALALGARSKPNAG